MAWTFSSACTKGTTHQLWMFLISIPILILQYTTSVSSKPHWLFFKLITTMTCWDDPLWLVSVFKYDSNKQLVISTCNFFNLVVLFCWIIFFERFHFCFNIQNDALLILLVSISSCWFEFASFLKTSLNKILWSADCTHHHGASFQENWVLKTCPGNQSMRWISMDYTYCLHVWFPNKITLTMHYPTYHGFSIFQMNLVFQLLMGQIPIPMNLICQFLDS